jgi:HNH endonuclease
MPSKKELEYYINSNGCWIVTSHKPYKDGRVRLRDNGKLTYAHIVVYKRVHGDIPDNKVVRHKCDNPQCCNPDHLELGTQADNVQDRYERNRSAKGSVNGNSRLTEDGVREIRKSTLSITELAKTYNVSYTTMRCIKKNITWTHVKETEVNS